MSTLVMASSAPSTLASLRGTTSLDLYQTANSKKSLLLPLSSMSLSLSSASSQDDNDEDADVDADADDREDDRSVPIADACRDIHSACHSGRHADAKVLIRVLARLSPRARSAMSEQYFAMYGESLKSIVKSKMGGGDFGNALQLLSVPPNVAEAKMVNWALGRFSVASRYLYPILCGRSSAELRLLDHTYADRYGRTLREVALKHLEGDFRALIVSCLDVPERAYDGAYHDWERAHEDARVVRDAFDPAEEEDEAAEETAETASLPSLGGMRSRRWTQRNATVPGWKEGRSSRDGARARARAGAGAGDGTETAMASALQVLCSSPPKHLRSVARAYEEFYGSGMCDAIDGDGGSGGGGGGGIASKAAAFLVSMKIEPERAVARLLRTSCADGGNGNWTDVSLLTSSLIRYQPILGHVAKAYAELYGESLADSIESRTKGSYRSLMLELVRASAMDAYRRVKKAESLAAAATTNKEELESTDDGSAAQDDDDDDNNENGETDVVDGNDDDYGGSVASMDVHTDRAIPDRVSSFSDDDGTVDVDTNTSSTIDLYPSALTRARTSGSIIGDDDVVAQTCRDIYGACSKGWASPEERRAQLIESLGSADARMRTALSVAYELSYGTPLESAISTSKAVAEAGVDLTLALRLLALRPDEADATLLRMATSSSPSYGRPSERLGGLVGGRGGDGKDGKDGGLGGRLGARRRRLLLPLSTAAEAVSSLSGAEGKYVYPILCGRSRSDMRCLKRSFNDAYGQKLHEFVASSFKDGDFRTFLTVCVDVVEDAYDATRHTAERASYDADIIRAAFRRSLGGWEAATTTTTTTSSSSRSLSSASAEEKYAEAEKKREAFAIICSSPPRHLRAINSAYSERYDESLYELFGSGTTTTTTTTTTTMSKAAKKAAAFALGMKISPYETIAHLIKGACSGLASVVAADDLMLTACLVRYRPLLDGVVQAYEKLFDGNLRDRLRSRTRGGHGTLLLKILDSAVAEAEEEEKEEGEGASSPWPSTLLSRHGGGDKRRRQRRPRRQQQKQRAAQYFQTVRVNIPPGMVPGDKLGVRVGESGGGNGEGYIREVVIPKRNKWMYDPEGEGKMFFFERITADIETVAM